MMSLRGIHLVFIGASIMVAFWGVGMYTSGRGSWGYLVFAVGSLASAGGMAVYLVAFMRKARRIGMH